MHIQREILRDGVSMTFGQTYELYLPKSGMLEGLLLYIRSTGKNADLATAIKWRLIDYISKIEVIGDGSEVIKSLDGPQALASAFYDDYREPMSMWRTYSNTTQRQWIPIHFGRGFLDELYGLDLSRFNQVTLKITNNASSTPFTTDIGLTVLALWLRDAVTPFAGYFREEEIKTWAPVANAWEYSELPVALPIRRILFRHRPFVGSADSKHSSSFPRGADDIDFTFKSGQVRVYRGDLEMLGSLAVMENPAEAETRGSIDRTQGYGFNVGIGYVYHNLGSGMADAGGVTSTIANMSKDVQAGMQEMAYRSGNGPLGWVCRGYGYGYCVPVFYAQKPGLEDLLIPEDVKQVDLNVHCQNGTTVSGTGTAAESAIVLSRLVR